MQQIKLKMAFHLGNIIRARPSVSAEMQVHNSSSVTFHNGDVLTVTISVPQNYTITNQQI